MQYDAVRDALRDWLDPGDGDEPVDLAAKFGLVQEGHLFPNGYFDQKLGPEFGVQARALTLGLEVKDLFIEANRPPARAASAHQHPWNGFTGSQDGGSARDSIGAFGRREKTIEWPRPRSWRRP